MSEKRAHPTGARWLALAGTLALLFLSASCGGSGERDKRDGQAPGAPTAGAEGGHDPGGRQPDASEGGGEGDDRSSGTASRPTRRDEAGEGRGAGSGCTYLAPPERLGVRKVAIDLTGMSCPEAKRLALAAAMGQPAGANLTIEPNGFECKPSTARKGTNVVYSCMRGGKRASFKIAWSG